GIYCLLIEILIMVECEVFPKLEKKICELDDDELYSRLDELKLGDKRKSILFNVLRGKVPLGFHQKLDIYLYVIKNIFPSDFDDYKINSHSYSKGRIEYDPAKNGQNLIKHGLSFNEVVSYSGESFGVLNVRCPADEGKRIIMFSRLELLENDYKLDLPLNDSINNDISYVISVVQSTDSGFRFISSRCMSSKKYKKTLNNALKNIFVDDSLAKSKLVEECLEILEKYLFPTNA
ncbi:hypothetical protein ACT5BL_003530, partial [Vibrio cholerae]